MSASDSRARLLDIIRKRSFGRGDITLASGRKSDFYFNLKPTMLDAEGAALLAELTLDALQGENIDYVGGLEMGAVPLAGAIAQLSFMRGKPIQAFFVRPPPVARRSRPRKRCAMPAATSSWFSPWSTGRRARPKASRRPICPSDRSILRRNSSKIEAHQSRRIYGRSVESQPSVNHSRCSLPGLSTQNDATKSVSGALRVRTSLLKGVLPWVD
jgi:hypothetical protein